MNKPKKTITNIITFIAVAIPVGFLLSIVLVYAMGILMVIKEPVRIKEDLNNKYLNEDYPNWKRTEIDGWASFMMPEEWQINEKDGVYLLSDENGETIAFGTPIGCPESRFDSFDQFITEYTGCTIVEESKEDVPGYQIPYSCPFTEIVVSKNGSNDCWYQLKLSGMEGDNEYPFSELYFVFPNDSLIACDELVEIVEALVYSYCY